MKHWKTSLIALAAAAVLPLASQAQQASGDFKERTIRVSHVVPKDHPFKSAWKSTQKSWRKKVAAS